MRRVLLLPIGSSGDVNPFLWLGRLLHARGHAVTVLANAVFGDTIRRLGLDFAEFGDEAEYHALLDHPDVWDPIKGPPLVLRYAGDVTRRHYDLIAAAAGTDRPLVLAPATAFAAQIARQTLGLPVVSVHLQPCIYLTVGDTAYVARGFGWLRALPAPLKRALFAGIRARIGAEVTPGVRRAAHELGVPAPRHPFRDWWQSPDGALCLWPEWYGPPQPEWRGATAVGFPLYDLADHVPPAPELEAFLAAGAPPVVFTAGTAMAQGAGFFAVAAEAVRLTGRRAIFATKFPARLPADLPADIFVTPYAPFSALLPRCAGLVHHGGIGTTAQALAAGIPQLVQPFSHDQPDNAARLLRLGVGTRLWRHEFSPAHLARELAAFADPARLARCAELARRIRQHDPAARALEALAPFLTDVR